MGEWKGPKQGTGVKGKSGRKSKEEELKIATENIKEKVTQEALIELANSKVYKCLGEAKNLRDVKDLGLPITLKGMTDKQENTLIAPKPLLYALLNNDKKECPAEFIPEQSKQGKILDALN